MKGIRDNAKLSSIHLYNQCSIIKMKIPKEVEISIIKKDN